MAIETRAARRFVRPWYWLIVLLIATVLSTLLIVQNSRTRIAQNERQFATAQELRFGTLKRSIDDLFGDAVQVASTGAEIYGRIPPEHALLSRIARDLYASILNRHIYGTGAFFVRGGFESSGKLVSIYVRRRDPRVPRSPNDMPFGSGVEVDYAATHARPQDDYRSTVWFRAAMRNRGRTIVNGPYTDQGRSFISVLRVFDRGGRPAGVMSVDILTSEFIELMRRNLEPGDVAAIYGPGPRFARMLGTAPAPRLTEDRIVLEGALLYTPHSHLEFSSDAGMLDAGTKAVQLETVFLLVALWMIAVMIAVGVIQRWAASERELDLEAQHARLERQIAIAHTVQAELRKAAYSDALTALPNRAAFLERANEIVGGPDGTHAIFFIDLDRFNRVNETLGHLAGDGLAETVERLRERNGRPGDRLELEITETTMMTNSEGAKRTIERLRALGVAFVLDDFGTGYSSLGYLQDLPIAGLKIDRTFVAPLPGDVKAVEIVRSIVMLARSMGLTVTAEGVETMDQFDVLRELDVDYAQGFFFSPAVDVSSVVLLQTRSISSRSAVE